MLINSVSILFLIFNMTMYVKEVVFVKPLLYSIYVNILLNVITTVFTMVLACPNN